MDHCGSLRKNIFLKEDATLLLSCLYSLLYSHFSLSCTKERRIGGSEELQITSLNFLSQSETHKHKSQIERLFAIIENYTQNTG